MSLGTAAAVRQGLKNASISSLVDIISRAYYASDIDNELRKAARKVISTIKKG